MASSTNLTARLAGGVFGIAVLGALLPAGTGGRTYAQQFTAGLHVALIAAAGVAVTGAILAATLIPATPNRRSQQLSRDRTQPDSGDREMAR
jgi:hypothetical protein